MTAETRQGDAETSMGTAYTQKGTAETARDDAMEAANTHVVGLLMMANAVHITTADDPDANRDETEIDLIEKNRLAHVAAVNTAVHVTSGTTPLSTRDPVLTAVDNQGGGTVTASWHVKIRSCRGGRRFYRLRVRFQSLRSGRSQTSFLGLSNCLSRS